MECKNCYPSKAVSFGCPTKDSGLEQEPMGSLATEWREKMAVVLLGGLGIRLARVRWTPPLPLHLHMDHRFAFRKMFHFAVTIVGLPQRVWTRANKSIEIHRNLREELEFHLSHKNAGAGVRGGFHPMGHTSTLLPRSWSES